MRIIAGTKRGMKLLSPKTFDTRPITDRVKESVFSIIYKYDLPADKKVADVFCGTGSLGLEALSRGASFVTFIEKAPKVVETLNKNIEKAGFVKNTKVIRANAFQIGAPVGFEEEKYDLVFVDPPYKMSINTKAGSQLYSLLVLLNDQLAENGVVIVRTQSSVHLLDEYENLRIIDRRQWGTMAVTILRFNDLECEQNDQ